MQSTPDMKQIIFFNTKHNTKQTDAYVCVLAVLTECWHYDTSIQPQYNSDYHFSYESILNSFKAKNY